MLESAFGAHEVVQLLSLALEPLGAIRHLALALGSTDCTTEVGLSTLAELALLALGSVERNNVVSDLHVVDTLADRLYDTTSLVSKNDGEGALGVLSREGVVISVADTGASVSST